jgi:hypothetical protein
MKVRLLCVAPVAPPHKKRKATHNHILQNQAAYRQHKVSIMHNSDDADTPPGSGSMSWSEGKLTREPDASAHSFQEQLEGQQILQRILVVEDDLMAIVSLQLTVENSPLQRFVARFPIS